jgi:hypothetical protein
MSTNVANASKTSNLGTGTFSKPGTTGGPALSMSNKSWLSLQTFLNNAKQLPSTLATLKIKMGSGAPTDMSDFQKLVTLYAQIQAEGTSFTNTTYPLIVSLASDIYDYNSSIGVCYNALNTIVKAINKAGGVATSAQTTEIKETFGYLAGKVQPFITKAGTVKTDLQSFVSQMETYSDTLSTYQSYYNTEYGSKSTAVKSLLSELATNISALKGYQDEYNHDVTVAATAATYAWIWPMGTVAAAIVAGTFGAKATAAKNKINATTATIKSLNAQDQADTNLMTDLNVVTNGISTIKSEMTSAVGIIEGIEGNWTAISADLGNIENQLSTGGTIPGFLLEGTYDTLISEWSTLAGLCNTFRQNAFVTINA